MPSTQGGSVPGANAAFKDIIAEVESGVPAKTGTELLFRAFPELLEELPLDHLHSLFGQGHFLPSRVGSLLTVPIFLSRGVSGEEGGSRNSSRTDLHCEPIANVAVQVGCAGRANKRPTRCDSPLTR